ncbi:MAG TPA: NCS2 family permease [Candidatus Dormibacteraeota bacterium]|jgi:AGZA family xanthine/uracil permease-like MFS transporter|nr:NCS2 family permease [Candidatus Dormibacteraeota bacterium]
MAAPGVARRAETGFLERTFKLRENATTVRTEVIGGLTTFFVMSYIVFVNPQILNFDNVPDLKKLNLGPGFDQTVAMTALTAGLLTIAMGLVANRPFAMAAGLGLNAVVAFQLILLSKLPWQAAMGIIFMEGIAITILVLTGLREAVLNAIPLSLKRAIGVGIGLFILLIGLVNAGIVVPGPAPNVPVALSTLNTGPIITAVIGLLLTLFLFARGVTAALLIGIVGTTVIAGLLHAIFPAYQVSVVDGKAVWPAALVKLPDLSNAFQGFNFEAFAKLGLISTILAVFTIMLSDFFDTMGTVVGIGGQAGWLDNRGRLPGIQRILLVDSIGAAFGGLMSASSNTTYIESAAGVSSGARTGLASVVTGVLFLLAMFISPIVGVVPGEATAPALIIVGFLMAGIASKIDLASIDEGLPALLTMAVMPFTFSITNGVGAGFVSYAFIKLVRGKAREVHPLMWVVVIAFILYFAQAVYAPIKFRE